jgi:hypothetical protein
MKYLHSGYILFCKAADHSENGFVDVHGLFDIYVEKSLPAKPDCLWVVGFGTPYERRQYKGVVSVIDPEGITVYSVDFQANDPDAVFKGHYIFRPDFNLTKEGQWTAKVALSNWKDNTVWHLERPFFVTLEKASHPDP